MNNECVLACETSCDETAFALYDLTNQKLIDHVVYSQTSHASFGGVVPEEASKEHILKIEPLLELLLKKNNLSLDFIDYYAVTTGPGLPGSLLIGTSFMQSIAWCHKKPCIPINHLAGHVYSSLLEHDVPFPHICLSVSGGHTSLYYVENEIIYRELGTTIDDAAGECFDKISKLMQTGYPGGPIIEKIARENNYVDSRKYPRLKKNDYFFSFSGLKTAVLYDFVREEYYNLRTKELSPHVPLSFKQDVASSLLCAVSDILCSRIEKALQDYTEIKAVTFVGGVACNTFIAKQIQILLESYNKKLFIPSRIFCTDNAAMIAQVASLLLKNNVCNTNNNYNTTIHIP